MRVLASSLALITTACAGISTPESAPNDAPLALVYRGPGACEGCPESLARLLERAGYTTLSTCSMGT